ncbi:DoxX family protein [Mucilaginibacter lappiensis]|uniref:DoxX family protein n=1 Tax=Mucilaginibacter lappiensis TaxID=354630 RepID=UPI003D24434E
MKTFQKFQSWGDAHHPKILDLIRMLLGIFLLIKGIVFLYHFPFLRDVIVRTRAINLSDEMITILIYYVTLAHMIGGLFIFLGLVTRVAALIQIPIVFGAVFFVNILNAYFNSELWLSVLVLSLLMLFVVIGSGPLSIDRYLTSISPRDGAFDLPEE